MENAADALKIAFSVLIFVLALSLSISCFSQANTAIKEIVNLRDEQTQYTYIEPSGSLTRIVGAETVITTMYKAYEENFEVRFYKRDGNPLPLYYKTDSYGKRVKDINGNDIQINYINLEKENFGTQGSVSAKDRAIQHLDFLLSAEAYKYPDRISEINEIFKNQLITGYTEGLYKFFSDKTFEEKLGEYEQGQDASKITKRVVTYIMQ